MLWHVDCDTIWNSITYYTEYSFMYRWNNSVKFPMCYTLLKVSTKLN